MESPHFALAFMNKLANSPWAPVIRLIEDPDILGFEPSGNLQEDLEDCALVVEETDSPVQRKTSNPECSSGEDSNLIARYHPSPCDSDDSVVICEEAQRSPTLEPSHNGRRPPNSSNTSTTDSRQGKAYKPGPKTKKRVPSSPGTSSKSKPCLEVKQSQSPSRVQNGGENYSGGATIAHIGNDQTKLIGYNGHLLKLKPMKVVLIDLACILCKQLIESRKTLKSSRGESATDICENPRINLKPTIISESDESTIIDVDGIYDSPSENLRNSSSSDVGNFKRPRENLSWGLDSIQELEKRRKLGKTVKNNNSDEQDAELATPCSTGARPCPAKSVTSSSKSKPPSSSSLPNNTFGLNAWRLGLVMQELKRLHELAEKLQKNHLKPELQKQVAYMFKYGLNEVARLVTKKSLNTIVAEHERAESEELREKERRASIEQNVGSGRFSKEMSPSDKLTQLSLLDKEKNNATSTSKELESTSTLDPPVVDVYMPTLVQGVAAGFLGIFDRLEKLESQCDNIERRVTKPKETPQSIYITEVE